MPTARIILRKKQGDAGYITRERYEIRSLREGEASFFELIGRTLTHQAHISTRPPFTVTYSENDKAMIEYRISTPETQDLFIITFEIIR